MLFLALHIFTRLFWRAHKKLLKQPPGSQALRAPAKRDFMSFIAQTSETTAWLAQWLVDSPYKGPSMWKVCLCHDYVIRRFHVIYHPHLPGVDVRALRAHISVSLSVAQVEAPDDTTFSLTWLIPLWRVRVMCRAHLRGCSIWKKHYTCYMEANGTFLKNEWLFVQIIHQGAHFTNMI